mgnify:CR=1 FL=1
MMKTIHALVLILVLLLLAACGGAADPVAIGPADAATAVVGVATPAVAEPVESEPPTAAPADTLPPVSADAPLTGPVIAFTVEDSYEDTSLGLFDTATGAYRDLPGTLGVAPGTASWFDGGCGLYANGTLFDLRGNVAWMADPAANVTGLQGTHLSPDRAWLAHVVESGVAADGGPARRDVEVVRLSAPFERFLLTGNGGGHPAALLWADATWLLYTDFDAAGILQVYRAAPDGGGREQLTSHTEPVGQINALALSPDGRRLAYGVRNVVVPLQPYTYDEVDEGWVGLVEVDSGESRQVRLPKLAGVELGRGLVWDATGERLLVIGDSLPVGDDDPLHGRQVHWLAADGTVERSFYQADAPSGQIGWVSPLGDIDTVLFSSGADTYRYEAGALRRLEDAERPPLGMELGRRPVGVLPAVVGFAGEAACRP